MNVPFVGQTNTVRDGILSVLSEEFPLSAKDIFSRVRKQILRNVTYQAVHKSLKELHEQKIVMKDETKYRLDPAWIMQLRDYSLATEQLYSGKQNPYKIIKQVDKKPIKLIFNDLSIFSTTMATILGERMLSKGQPTPIRVLINHAWWPLKFNFTDFDLLKKINQNNPGTYGIVVSNSPFDKWVVQQYNVSARMYGGYGVIAPKAGPVKEDTIVVGEYVIRVIFSNETKKFLDETYSKLNGFYDLLLFYYNNKEKEFPAQIEVVIEKNLLLSQLITEKVELFFKKKRVGVP